MSKTILLDGTHHVDGRTITNLGIGYRGATFPSNKFEGLVHPYRDPAFDDESFAELLEQSDHMISASYGWAPNRAAKVYHEALEEQAERRPVVQFGGPKSPCYCDSAYHPQGH